jgi:parallel beta-helix repeat protein
MQKKRLCLLIGALIVLNVLSISGNANEIKESAQIAPSNPRPDYTNHSPIRIIGNSQFVPNATNGVISGSGAISDPYIISGWDINSSSATGIFIESTTLYFIINNCYIHGEWMSGINGIQFIFVQNGTVQNSNMTSNDNGIILENSNKNTINRNNFTINFNGSSILSSNSNAISNNSFYISNINIEGAYNNLISNNSLISASLSLETSNSNTIIKNTIRNSGTGMNINDANNNHIWENIISNCGSGFSVFGSNENYICNNNISQIEWDAMEIGRTTSNYIINNSISGKGNGIEFQNCISQTLYGNRFYNCSIIIFGGIEPIKPFNSHIITPNNTVNEKPIYYYTNQSHGSIPLNAGEVILMFCSNFTIRDQNLSYGTIGLYMVDSNNCTITNTTCSFDYWGISLSSSDCNIISNSKIFSNKGMGITISGSNLNNITKNLVWLNEAEGITVNGGLCNRISFNNVVNNNDGISLGYSSESSTISNNTISSSNNGIVIMYGSNNNTVQNNYIDSCTQDGIWVCFSDLNKVLYNNLSDNLYGVALDNSNNNKISYNVFYNNTFYGNYIWSNAIFNHIHHNNFFCNNGAGSIRDPAHIQGYDEVGNNFWNDTNGEGNFWSDWTGPDFNHDGIVDNKYNISGGMNANDLFPLVNSVKDAGAKIPEFLILPTPIILSILMLISGIVMIRRRLYKTRHQLKPDISVNITTNGDSHVREPDAQRTEKNPVIIHLTQKETVKL